MVDGIIRTFQPQQMHICGFHIDWLAFSVKLALRMTWDGLLSDPGSARVGRDGEGDKTRTSSLLLHVTFHNRRLRNLRASLHLHYFTDTASSKQASTHSHPCPPSTISSATFPPAAPSISMPGWQRLHRAVAPVFPMVWSLTSVSLEAVHNSLPDTCRHD